MIHRKKSPCLSWCLYLSQKCIFGPHFQLKYRHQPIPCIHLDMPIAKFSCKIPFFSYFLHTDPAHIWATCWSNCMMRWNPFPLQPPPWSVIWRTTCGRVAGKGVYWMLSFYMVLPAYWQGSHYTQNLASIINVFLYLQYLISMVSDCWFGSVTSCSCRYVTWPPLAPTFWISSLCLSLLSLQQCRPIHQPHTNR